MSSMLNLSIDEGIIQYPYDKCGSCNSAYDNFLKLKMMVEDGTFSTFICHGCALFKLQHDPCLELRCWQQFAEVHSHHNGSMFTVKDLKLVVPFEGVIQAPVHHGDTDNYEDEDDGDSQDDPEFEQQLYNNLMDIMDEGSPPPSPQQPAPQHLEQPNEVFNQQYVPIHQPPAYAPPPALQQQDNGGVFPPHVPDYPPPIFASYICHIQPQFIGYHTYPNGFYMPAPAPLPYFL